MATRLERAGLEVRVDRVTLQVIGPDRDQLLDLTRDAIADAGARVRRITTRRRTLEDLFTKGPQ